MENTAVEPSEPHTAATRPKPTAEVIASDTTAVVRDAGTVVVAAATAVVDVAKVVVDGAVEVGQAIGRDVSPAKPVPPSPVTSRAATASVGA